MTKIERYKWIKNFLGLILLTFFISIGNYHIYAFEISRSFEINFDYEVTFFDVGGQIIVWDANASKIFIYEENKLTKTINADKGQGPQDFQLVSAVLVNLDQYYIWDRMQKRFSIYKKNWDPVEIKPLRNISANSLPLGITGKGFLFTWNEIVKHEKGSTMSNNIGVINANGQKNSFYKISAPFNKMGYVNYDRPILITTFSNTGKLYFAHNNDYKIYTIDLNSQDPKPSLVIEKKVKAIPWRKDFEELQWEILTKSPHDPEYIYPGYLPPLFSLAANDDIVAVITNESLHEKKTVVDFFKDGKFLGMAKLPLLCSQYLVFPSFLCLPPQAFLGKDYLLTFSYDTKTENFKIIKWQIRL